MKWVKRITIALIYLGVTCYMLLEITIPPVTVLLFVVIFSVFISKNGVLTELENFKKKAR